MGQNIIATGQITITDYSDSVIGVLSSDSHNIPTNFNGENGDYNGASTTLTIMEGYSDVTSGWNITVEESYNNGVKAINGVLSGSTYTVSSLNFDSAVVTFVANKSGHSELRKEFKVAKNKQGAIGESARNYYINTDVSNIKQLKNGTFLPNNIEFNGRVRIGASLPSDHSGYFVVYEQSRSAITTDEYIALAQQGLIIQDSEYIISDLEYPYVERYSSDVAESHLTYEYKANPSMLLIEFYDDIDRTNMLDTKSIPIVIDGASGYNMFVNVSDGIVFKFDKDNVSTGVSSTTLTANSTNIENATYAWEKDGVAVPNNITNVLVVSSEVLESADSASYKCIVSGFANGESVSLSDTVTVIKAKDGATGDSSYSIGLTNESVNISSDENGENYDLANARTGVLLYLGTMSKTATIGDIYPSGCTASTDGVTMWLTSINTGINDGYVDIQIKDADTVIGTRRFTFAKSRKGATGKSSGSNKLLKTDVDRFGVGNFVTNGSPISVDTSDTYLGKSTLKIDMTTSYQGAYYNDWVVLERNKEYVYSMVMRSTQPIVFSSIQPLHMWLNTSMTAGHLEIITGNTTSISENEWTKVWISFKTPDTQESYYMRPYVYQGVFTIGQIINICEVQLEEGSSATNWSPSIGDIMMELDGLGGAIESFADTALPALEDKLLNKAEKESVKQSLNIIKSEKSSTDNQYVAVYDNADLYGSAKTNLYDAKIEYDTTYLNLSNAINTVLNVADGTRIENSLLNTISSAFTGYASAYATLRTRLEEANRYSTDSKINSKTGRNMWIANKYALSIAGVALNMSHIRGERPIESKYMNDSTSFTFNSDYYVGHFYTNVYVSTDRTLNLSISHDDACSVFSNGVIAYVNNAYLPTPAPLSIPLKKGWNQIDMLLQEGNGGDSILLSALISSLVDDMSCYLGGGVSTSQIRQLSDEIDLRVQTGDIISAINLSTDPINGARVEITGDTTFKDDVIMDSGKIQSADGGTVLDLNNNSFTFDKPFTIGAKNVATVYDVNTAVDGIEVGGRNLLKDSQKIFTLPNNTGLGNAVLMTDETIPYYRVTGTTHVSTFGPDGNSNSACFTEPMIIGAVYTASMDVRVPVAGDVTFLNYGGKNITTANQWTKLSTTYIYEYEGYRVIGALYSASNVLDYRNLKIEKGNKATDWMPAPEDIQSQIDTSVSTTDVEYYLSTSSSSLSGGSWVTTAPAWVNGNYMWSRTKVVLNNGATTYKPSANGTCIAGATGSIGATGTGITSITEEYYLSTSKTDQVDGSWVTTPPTWSTGKYMWTRSKIVYNNPTSTVYTTAVVDSSWEAVNEIEVGGRNHFLTSGNFGTTVKNWANNGGGLTVSTTERWNGWNTIQTTVGTGIYGNWYTLDNGVEYTYSVMIKSSEAFTGEGSTPIHYHAGLNNVPEGKIQIVSYNTSYEAGDIGKYKLLHIVFKLTSDANSFRPFVYFGSGTRVFNIAYLKLEKGNKATDWTPAPEDVAYDIEQKADSSATLDAINAVASSAANAQSTANSKLDKSSYDNFINEYVDYKKALASEQSDSSKSLQDAKDAISLITNNMGDMKESWKFNNGTQIDATGKGLLLSDSAGGMNVIISNDRISFFDRGAEVAYISNKALKINNGIFTNSAQIGAHLISPSPSNPDITVVSWVGN